MGMREVNNLLWLSFRWTVRLFTDSATEPFAWLEMKQTASGKAQ
jgi:hypothetical protein